MGLIEVGWSFLIFIFGVSVGSFVNAWVWRTRENLRITRGRSMCPSCRVKINWYDNIPILSFIFLLGRCRNCKIKITKHYLVTEVWMGLIFVFAANWHLPRVGFFSIELLRDLIILSLLTFIFLYDLKYKEIMDFSTIPTSLVLFLLSIFFGWQTWSGMLLGVVVGAGFFLAQYLVSKGRWIGGGDIRLGIFMGVILGWPSILVALLLAYVFGAAVSLCFVLGGKQKLTDETAFGTFLVAATIVTMFFGKSLVTWYFGLL